MTNQEYQRQIDLEVDITKLREQIEDMKSCCICGKLYKCEAWKGVNEPPIHNLNDAPCEEWELG